MKNNNNNAPKIQAGGAEEQRWNIRPHIKLDRVFSFQDDIKSA